jgi:glycosyltransferase involved in cell wall biosynthesis
MTHATRNYLSYTLASFIIFFDVLILARALFTENLSVVLIIFYTGLLVGLFVAWRAKNFGQHSARYGFMASVLTIILNFANTDSSIFWLIFIINATIFSLLVIIGTVLAPPKPLPVPLNFGQTPPRIEQDFAKKFRQKLKLNAADHTILLYGKPEHAKQFDLVIKALPNIKKLFPDQNIRLLLTTWENNNREVRKLKGLIRELDLAKNIRLIKTTEPEVLKYVINLADVIVFPYRSGYLDPADLNAVLPFLKALVVPDTALFAQLVNNKNCLKLKNIRNLELLAVTIERLLKNDQMLLTLGFNLSQTK